VLATKGNDLKLFTVTIRRRPIYTVTFETSGSAVSSQQVEEDSSAVQPDETIKTGYTFENWTYNNSAVSFPYTIIDNTTLTATFKTNTYTATLNVNDGDELDENEFIATYDDQFNLATPTRTGYTFLGWYDGATNITSGKWTYTEDKTFIAQWQINQYSVVLNLNNELVTDLIIPNTVTSIKSYAFYGCSSLTSIEIPSSVTYIGRYTFNNCSGLTSVVIPSSVTSVGDYAFYNCLALTEIKYNATACNDLDSSNHVFYNAGKNGDGIKVTMGANVTRIPAYLFYPYSSSYPPKIISVEFEKDSVCESIGSDAFRGCSSLTSIELPSSVTSIESDAFNNCSSLNAVYS
jgi:uncharacterized repeat protein (TIGR02543 family)